MSEQLVASDRLVNYCRFFLFFFSVSKVFPRVRVREIHATDYRWTVIGNHATEIILYRER